MVTRRQFIELGTAASIFGGGCFRLSACSAVRIGVVSDTHVTGPECAERLEEVLAFFAGRRVDAVVHCGDLTDLGYLSQLDVFISAWRRVMPPGIPLVAAFGNRDLSDTGKMSDERRAMDRDKLILSDPGSAMKRLCGWSAELGMRSSEVKGVPIVAADWRHEGDVELFMAARPRLRSVAAAEMLISVQHPHPQGTVFGAAAGSWMADDGRATCYFRMFPRVVSLSGHSHRPFASADSSWCGDFSAFAAGSFYLGPPTAPGGKEASVLTIFGDHAEIERRDISTGFSEVLPVEMQAGDMAASPRKANGEFVFAQWNIGHYSLGRRSSTDVSLDESAGRAEEYRRMLEKVDADFLGICEYSSQFDKGGGLARKLVFGAYRHFECGPNSGYQCNAIASSKVPLSNISAVDYPRRVQPTYRMSCEVQICGKRTVIVETHLDLDPEARRSQIEALANEFGAEERVILSGDFNIDGPEEFAPLKEAGFAAANFGAFGVFNTHRRRKVALTPAIDNVFVKGFSFCGVRVEDATLDLSDHRILVCRIRVE